MFGLTDAPPIGALTEHGPSRKRFGDWHDSFHLEHLTKKSDPGFLRGPDRIGTGTSARAAIHSSDLPEGWFDVRELGAVLGFDSYASSSSRICGLS
jgi:hypothetical protein